MATPKLRLITTSRRFNTTNCRALSAGVHLPAGRYIAPGAKIMTQSAANSLPSVRQKVNYQTRKPSLFANKPLRLTVSQRPKQVATYKAA